MLKHLWKVESDECADVIATSFVESGLASREALRVGEEYVSYLSLHDSLHDFATAKAKHIGDTKEAHDCLLRATAHAMPRYLTNLEGHRAGGLGVNTGWGRTPKPCRHLLGAGRGADLVRLLLSPQWVRWQLEMNDILSLEIDFALGIKAIQDGMREMQAMKTFLRSEKRVCNACE